MASSVIVVSAAAMLSAFVLLPFGATAAPTPTSLVRTLSALVPAAVDGLVRDVTVLAGAADEQTRHIADEAGCRMIEAASFGRALQDALEGSRSAMLLVLRAGAFFDARLTDELAQHFSVPRPDAAERILLIRQAPAGLVARALPRSSPVVGFVGSRAKIRTAAESFEALVRGLRHTRTLTARAEMSG